MTCLDMCYDVVNEGEGLQVRALQYEFGFSVLPISVLASPLLASGLGAASPIDVCEVALSAARRSHVVTIAQETGVCLVTPNSSYLDGCLGVPTIR